MPSQASTSVWTTHSLLFPLETRTLCFFVTSSIWSWVVCNQYRFGRESGPFQEAFLWHRPIIASSIMLFRTFLISLVMSSIRFSIDWEVDPHRLNLNYFHHHRHLLSRWCCNNHSPRFQSKDYLLAFEKFQDFAPQVSRF